MVSLLTSNKRLGADVSCGPTLLSTFEQNSSLFTFQTGWGKMTSSRKFAPQDRLRVRDHCLMYDKNFYVHAACSVHLGQPPAQQPPTIAYINGILHQLDEIPGTVVVHIGKGVNSSISNVLEALSQLRIPEETGRAKHKIVLENAAGEGYEKGRNWEELYQVFRFADEKIGLCIDTQHSFGAGMIDFRKPEEVTKFFSICDTYFPGRLQLIHLNDSGVPFNAHVDSHGGTALCGGYIWSPAAGGDAGLRALLKEGYRRELDFVLETGGAYDLHNLHTVYYHL
jgi:deoxyribonuclease-4